MSPMNVRPQPYLHCHMCNTSRTVDGNSVPSGWLTIARFQDVHMEIGAFGQERRTQDYSQWLVCSLSCLGVLTEMLQVEGEG